MGLGDINRACVEAALDEFDKMGRDRFLEFYGYGPARRYWLEHHGRHYDSKAIVGVAHKWTAAGAQPLSPSDFSGGAAKVQPLLEKLGFTVVQDGDNTVVHVDGHRIDLTRLYATMWQRAETETKTTRLYKGSGSDSSRPAMKRLLNELFDVPVSDEKIAVNDAARREANQRLSTLGWAHKVDANGRPVGPISRHATYRLYHDPGVRSGRRPPHYLTFRANADHYDIDAAVAELEVDTWVTRGRDVLAGDRAMILRMAGKSGKPRAIIAFATVLTDPEPTRDLNNPYYRDAADTQTEELRVLVEYEAAPGLPLLADHHEAVRRLNAYRAHSGTVFYVEPEHWDDLTTLAGLSRGTIAAVPAQSNIEYEDPPHTYRQPRTRRPGAHIAPPGMLAAPGRDTEALGIAGEDWVVVREQQRLEHAGRKDLAERVERISVTIGDGKGYDVMSYNADGSERHIEVKATTLGRTAAFDVTANELAVSKLDNAYWLYRVYNLDNGPACWTRPGPLDADWNLLPTSYRVRPDVLPEVPTS